jgi:hypothetical protein
MAYPNISFGIDEMLLAYLILENRVVAVSPSVWYDGITSRPTYNGRAVSQAVSRRLLTTET